MAPLWAGFRVHAHSFLGWLLGFRAYSGLALFRVVVLSPEFIHVSDMFSYYYGIRWAGGYFSPRSMKCLTSECLDLRC